MQRAAIIDRLWEDCPLFLTRSEFERTLDGWDIEEVRDDNGMAVVVSKGAEFHFQILDHGFQVTREHLRRWPGALIAKYGYAVTRTPKDDERQIRFNRRLGFEVVGEDDFDYTMRITHLRVKDTTCPSSP